MSQPPEAFPLTPIYDQLLREQEQPEPCPPTDPDTSGADQPDPPAEPAWPDSPPS